MIKDTYTELIIEQIIKEILLDGDSPSISEINTRYEDFVEENDIQKPLFIAENYHVEFEENSSASKYNNTNNDILRDLKVLYRHLFKISDQSVYNFDRWKSEMKLLEGRLDTLYKRVESLLLLAEDTAGYFNFMQDNFADNSKVDLENSTAYVNVDKNLVSIGTSSLGATRIDLSELRDEHVEFNILSRNNLVSSISSNQSHTKYAISDVSNFWQEKVYTSKPGPFSAELKINLLEDREITRIDIDLHMSNQNSTVQITPMYSSDNYSWNQLPISNYSRSIIDKTIFQFSPITAKWFKFIMTKIGFDQVHQNLYIYEFGVDEISFYSEGFAEDAESVLVSEPLYVNGIDNTPEEFSRIVLEVCEDVPDGTSIEYFIAASNDSTVPLENFASIDPLSRTNTSKPTVLDFGDLETVTVSDIGISYDPSADFDPGTGVGTFINPAETFTFISAVSSSTATELTATESSARYSFMSSNDRILDHCLSDAISVAEGTLELWRNVSTAGDDTKVRGYSNGWGFSDPFYTTTVDIENATGHSIDFGGKTVIIDGSAKNGKVTLAVGKHTVSVHKDNWKPIVYASVTNLSTLKTADSLYPYNHRYLVEGYPYSAGWATTDEKVYKGCDLVGEFFMKEVSIFDLNNNVLKSDYNKFALDFDTADASRLIGGNPAAESQQGSTTVFVLKIDESNPDFINEKFVLRFKSANALFKYLRFKAVLKTTDSTITPFLDSYRIKISS